MLKFNRNGLALVEVTFATMVLGVCSSLFFAGIDETKKKSCLSKSHDTFSQWAAGCSRYKSAYGFYPNVGSTYKTDSDSLFKLEQSPNCINFIKCLSAKSPLGTPLSAGATGDRAKFNRNGEVFVTFSPNDYESNGTITDTSAQLVDSFGNRNIRVVFDTDGNGILRKIPTSLPDDLTSMGNSVGVPGRIVIFTTAKDIGSASGLTASDVADVYVIF
jgi:hypothetical protein